MASRGAWTMCLGCVFGGVTGAAAGEVPPRTETVVKVQRGGAWLENSHGKTYLPAGTQGRLAAGRAPEACSPADEANPAARGPLEVLWQPQTRELRVEGRPIPLREAAGVLEGQAEDGRSTARVERDGTLSVRDLATDRQARRTPEGAWTYRVGGLTLDVDPASQATVRLPGGRTFRAPCAKTEPAAPPLPHRWELGIHLDAQAADRLVVGTVDRGSPAERAGLRPGDELLALGGLDRPSKEQVVAALKKLGRGEEVPIVARRAGQTRNLRVRSGDWE